MRALIPVLLTGRVGDHPLRLFRSPLNGPDLPWHSVDDLHVALRLSREVRRNLKRSLHSNWHARTIATSDGVTTIASHPLAQGLIGAAEDVGCAPYTAAEDYARAGATALSLITAGMSSVEGVAYSLAAFQRAGEE